MSKSVQNLMKKVLPLKLTSIGRQTKDGTEYVIEIKRETNGILQFSANFKDLI